MSTYKWNNEKENHASIPQKFVRKRYLEKEKCYLQIPWALQNVKEWQNKYDLSFFLSSQEDMFGVSSYTLRDCMALKIVARDEQNRPRKLQFLYFLFT